MKRRGAVLLFAVIAVGLYGVPAGAVGYRGSHARVLVVDDDAGRRTCYGKHHRRFQFHTIQEAVTAARSGDTIKVCPGRYEEVVTVDKPDLTIKGANAWDFPRRPGRRAAPGGRADRPQQERRRPVVRRRCSTAAGSG